MAENDQPKRRSCGTMQVHERMMRTVPGYMDARAASENHAWRAALTPLMGRTGCTKIPVVVHVVHKTQAQNVSDAQIQSQIDVLTADFRKMNGDVGTVPAPFAPLVEDARLEFELATTDPDGKPSNGITRTKTNKDSFDSDDSVKSSASGGADAWPSDRYLNIWVCQLSGGLLGYAQFPGGPAATDGVVILHSAFGTAGTAAAPFNLGRTTTHEVGHWLNLRHIWGDDGTGCFGSDFVADTPNHAGPNYGTPTFPSVTCGNAPHGDMFMNYMDYVDDAAMVMFSAGQVTRMQATLDGLRSSIGVQIPCAKQPPKDPPKELPKDPPKDFPKDPPKDFPKDPPKDFPKDPPKDFPKDPPKDFPKDPPKDFPKDPPKDFPKDPPKDFPKDPPKDFPKDPPKDFPKDPPKDFPKDFPGDPPKGPFDPPGPFPGGPVGQPGPGGVPFVLATPAGAGYGGQIQARQQMAALAAAYLRLMGHYQQLHARGMLDAQGMAAWQEIAAAYQQLLASGGAGWA